MRGALFIGLRGINGTLTAFLGLLTDFKRKLDLAVGAIPPKAGMRMASPSSLLLGVPPDLKSGVKKCPNLLMLCGFEIRSKGGCFPFVVVGGLQIPRF